MTRSVRLGHRVFDVLEVLIAASGAIVTKEELINRLWPTALAEENSLQVHLCSIQEVLGDDRGHLATVPTRGYRPLPALTSSC